MKNQKKKITTVKSKKFELKFEIKWCFNGWVKWLWQVKWLYLIIFYLLVPSVWSIFILKIINQLINQYW